SFATMGKPNDEIRMTKSELTTNDEAQTLLVSSSVLGHLQPISMKPGCPTLHYSITPSAPARSARLGHFDRIKRALEFFLRQNPFLPSNFANGSPGFRALLFDFSGSIVPNLWRETGHHCHRKLHQFAAALFVCHDAAHAFLAENLDDVRQQSDRFEKIVCHHRHHHVELEIPVRACPGDGRVVANHLRAHHHHRFAHHGIHFAWHDGAARLRSGKPDLADPAARPAAKPANVVCDFKQTHRDRL